MVSKIMSAPKNSLILIEELENGLHPIAVRNMTKFLVKIASENNHQVIFSTHSEDAIVDLPPEAIWACIEGKAIQGKLNIESLRAIVGSVEKSHVIFAEDEFAVDFTTEIIRQSLPAALNTLEVHKAGGYPYVCQVAQYHNSNPSIKSTAYAVVDGDQGDVENPDLNVYCLPNGIPEKIVFDFVIENIDNLLGVVQQRCQCTQINQDEIKKRLLKVGGMSIDPHDIFSQIAFELDFSSEIVIRRAFISIYVQQNGGLMAPLLEKIKDAII